MKKLFIILLASALLSSCAKEDKQCQDCHTVEYVYIGWGQWHVVQDIGFTDCTLVVRDEDRTYEVAGDTYRRVTKCIR